MSVAVGSRLGVYEVLATLGKGGMGEVYRARDTRLQRFVALKILPEAFANDPDRLARFEREARALATLNHPNIAQIYGVEESAGVRGLVMELVPGQTLDEIIRRPASGAGTGLPLGQALTIARQMADALEAAHEAGIVHRDLKPANVKIRDDNVVKILDFGLAKATGADQSSDSSGSRVPDDSPTMASPAMTQMGVILGTAAYMSPEQARGKAVDRRADIWAFGVVLFEMLSGRRLFTGETVSDMVASVLRQEIDWTLLPATTPDAVRRLLARCLDRDVKKRLQAIGEARLVLEEGGGDAGDRRARSSLDRPGMRRVRWLAVAGLLIAATVLAFAVWPRNRSGSESKAAAARAGRSIAVLPFVNSSGKADDEYFADGMTDELIASLGKVPGLRVAARSSAFSFKGQKTEVREVGRKLGVETVLEGTVRRSGQRLRVTASLVSATDGLQLWSSTFENDGGDAFAVQDEVTRGVVAGLSLQLGGSALAASQAGRTKDPEAHDLYLRGLAAANAASEADLRRALELYQQAIARDADFALAYAGMAWVHIFLADAYVPPIEAYAKAKAAAQAALQRDNQLADAHALVAYATFGSDWGDPATIDREFHLALELDPNSANTLNLLGTYRCFGGRTDEALRELDRAGQLDPLSPLAPFLHEFCNYLAQRYRAVIDAHRTTAAIDPSFVYLESWVGAAYRELGDYPAALREYAAAAVPLKNAPQYGQALTYVRMGRTQDAREIMRRLEERAATRYVPFATRAMVHAALGDSDAGIALLQQSVDKRELFVYAMRGTPEMMALLKDPRARRILDQAAALPRSAAGQRASGEAK